MTRNSIRRCSREISSSTTRSKTSFFSSFSKASTSGLSSVTIFLLFGVLELGFCVSPARRRQPGSFIVQEGKHYPCPHISPRCQDEFAENLENMEVKVDGMPRYRTCMNG
jgi:hypothetical protein